MSNTRFASGDAIRYGWEAFKKHAGFLIGMFVIMFIIMGVFYAPMMWALSEGSNGLYYFFYLIYLIVTWVLSIGMIKILLTLHDGKEAKFSDLFTNWNLLGKYIGFSIVQGLVIGGGFLLLIVPGVIFAIMFSLGMYYVVDKGMGPIEAMKASKKATDGAKLDLFGFFILIGLLNMAGAIVFGLGLLITVPMTAMAMVYVYRHLDGGSATPAAAPAGPEAAMEAVKSEETPTETPTQE